MGAARHKETAEQNVRETSRAAGGASTPSAADGRFPTPATPAEVRDIFGPAAN